MATKKNIELDKRYDAKATEHRVSARWEKQGYANPDNLPERHKDPFVVMLPPPNVTGSLHMGHALEVTLTDCLIRFRRMQGRKTLWLPGTDHAGIATQRVVEKKIKKEQGKTRFELGREKFLEEVLSWKEEYGDKIYQQLKRIGTSLDFSRARFTMDEGYVKAVETAFAHYLKKGWIYQGERVVNWCVQCATSLSDLELEYEEEKDFLYHIRYPFADEDGAAGGTRGSTSGKLRGRTSSGTAAHGITVATTRPETMLGDTAVAVHPDDKRYKIVIGKSVELPLTGRTISIVADDAIDMEFGTGALKVTPAHDFTDAEIGERHGLDTVQVIDERGKMNKNAPKAYQDLTVSEARKKVVKDLDAQGYLQASEPLTHSVAVCYRCGTTVEPLVSKQWFLKMSELATKAREAYERGDVRFTPQRWADIAIERLKHERDWCISRQLWWGHRIPVEGEEDVLDTWFSSTLWPFAALGWPMPGPQKDAERTQKNAGGVTGHPNDLERFYPTQWMTSARDILFLWINRMVFSGIEFMGEAPFAEVFIHPTVLTKSGERMSKSLGTGIDPIELIEEHGADATRFGLLWQTTGVQDIRFDESAILAGKKFTNKIWNATRYVLMLVGQDAVVPAERPKAVTEEDEAILTALDSAIEKLTGNIEDLRFGQALEGFYKFFWHTFADVYIEQTKVRSDEAVKAVLLWTLAESLKALHPFIPFVTDELYEKLPHGEGALPITIAHWPTGSV